MNPEQMQSAQGEFDGCPTRVVELSPADLESEDYRRIPVR